MKALWADYVVITKEQYEAAQTAQSDFVDIDNEDIFQDFTLNIAKGWFIKWYSDLDLY